MNQENLYQQALQRARTSISHPIRVMRIDLATGGVIGITFCPGKKDISLRGWEWDRDVDMDLKIISEEGWHHLVTLVGDEELAMLGVPDLGAKVSSYGINWIHYPIIDGGYPHNKEDFAQLRRDLKRYLDAGQQVVVHCRGGLGRAGTLAATLLFDTGEYSPIEATELVRAARPGAIETRAQELFIEGLKHV